MSLKGTEMTNEEYLKIRASLLEKEIAEQGKQQRKYVLQRNIALVLVPNTDMTLILRLLICSPPSPWSLHLLPPAAPAAKAAVVSAQRAEEVVASANSDKYHRLTCDYADNILEENKVYYKTPADAERDDKYACSVCRP